MASWLPMFYFYGTYFDRGNEVYANPSTQPSGVPQPAGTAAHDSWSQAKGGFRIDTDGPSDDKFTLQGDYYNGSANDPTVPGVGVQSGENVLGRWTHTFSSDSGMSLQMYYDRTNYSTPEPEGGGSPPGFLTPAGILTDDLDTYDLNFQHNFSIGDRNRIIWGAGYRFTHDAVGNTPRRPDFTVDPEPESLQWFCAGRNRGAETCPFYPRDKSGA